jgi:hypothetical protein
MMHDDDDHDDQEGIFGTCECTYMQTHTHTLALLLQGELSSGKNNHGSTAIRRDDIRCQELQVTRSLQAAKQLSLYVRCPTKQERRGRWAPWPWLQQRESGSTSNGSGSGSGSGTGGSARETPSTWPSS